MGKLDPLFVDADNQSGGFAVGLVQPLQVLFGDVVWH